MLGFNVLIDDFVFRNQFLNRWFLGLTLDVPIVERQQNTLLNVLSRMLVVPCVDRVW